MGRYIRTSSFHTFDPIRLAPDILIEPIHSSIEGEHDLIESVLEGFSGIPELKRGEKLQLDKATMLFISILDWQDNGSAPRTLDSGHSRERLGRFPSNDGNAIEYLLEFTAEGEDFSKLHQLLEKLARGMGEEKFGHSGFDRGSAGVDLLGWLDVEDVNILRKEIESGKWQVKSDEPLDGGVQDAFRHLLVFLRSASKRKCGILMRRHS